MSAVTCLCSGDRRQLGCDAAGPRTKSAAARREDSEATGTKEPHERGVHCVRGRSVFILAPFSAGYFFGYCRGDQAFVPAIPRRGHTVLNQIQLKWQHTFSPSAFYLPSLSCLTRECLDETLGGRNGETHSLASINTRKRRLRTLPGLNFFCYFSEGISGNYGGR